MQSSSESIVCDFCLDNYSIDFVYYSFDFREVIVRDGSRQYTDKDFSADVCERCMESFRDRLKQVYVPSRNGIVCDVSGVLMSGQQFRYYKCQIAKVEVLLSGRPYVCSGCGGILKDENTSCEKCKEGIGIRRADISVDKEHLELNFSPEMFDKFVEHIENMKKYLEVDNGKQ